MKSKWLSSALLLTLTPAVLSQTPSTTSRSTLPTRGPAPTTTSRATTTTTSVSLRPIDIACNSYKSALPNNTLGWYSTGTPNVVPTPAFIGCPPLGCFVYCASDDTTGECIRVASSELVTCTDQKSAYDCSVSSYYAASVSGSFTVTDTLIITNTITNVQYPTTVPSNQTFTFDTTRGTRRIVTPVYVYGTPTTSTTVSTSTLGTYTFTSGSKYVSGLYTESPPYCSIIVAAITTCQYCSIVAPTPATVYYWPDQTPGPSGNFPSVPANPSTTRINGIDMTSPSVYVIFPTLIGRDSCTRTRGIQRDVVVAIAPPDFSSMYNYNQKSVYNFGDLTPTVNAAAYERQSSCVAAQGCATIFPYYAPPIAFPPQVTGLDASWSTCTTSSYGAPANPPIPIRPLVNARDIQQTVIATSETAAATTLVTSVLGASPCSTHSPQIPTATSIAT